MMRFSDAATLAFTKLKAHRVRTGIITVVSGILFGVLTMAVVLAQGVFDSSTRYNSVGLGERYILSISEEIPGFSVYDRLEDPEFINAVEAEHAAIVAKKQAAAKKYGIQYNPKTEDPSPITVDEARGLKHITPQDASNELVLKVSDRLFYEKHEPVEVKDAISKYQTAKVIGEHRIISTQGSLAYMKDGKEGYSDDSGDQRGPNVGFYSDGSDKIIHTLPQTVADPFISVNDYDPASGELPIILPYSDAEKFLGLEKLSKDATAEDQRSRLEEVKNRVGEVLISYCYRNQTSLELLGRAKSTQEEIEKNKNNANYRKPSLIYKVPDPTTCGPVEIASDTRTAAEKKADDNLKLYQQEIGEYGGDPEQYKLVFRAIGISSDIDISYGQSGIASMISTVLASPLGYNAWNIPLGLLEQVPQESRPEAIFGEIAKNDPKRYGGAPALVEFGNPEEAREFMKSITPQSGIYTMPFGSSSLMIEEVKEVFQKFMLGVVLVVGAVASLILGGLVGRTIADSRRETAVFRSIGATRLDISSIYTLYTFLFSLRVAIFALVVGLIGAFILNAIWSENATIAADVAFGVIGKDIQFSFVSLASVYLPIIIGVIILVGLISVILPLLRNVGRNPIHDMRDE